MNHPTRLLFVLLVVASLTVPLRAAAAGVPLIDAVKRADTAAVRALLKQKADVNASEADGSTALHWAANRDDVDTATLLIGAGASVEAANRYGVTPLSVAAVNGSPAMIELLLKAGANANAALPEGETPLMTAARTGNAAAVKVLLAHGAAVNTKENWKGQNALMWAAAEGHVAAARALIEHGAVVNAWSKERYTPLHFAARQGDLEMVRLLLESGANPDALQVQGASPLIVAVHNASWDVAALLLERGADPNIDGTGFTPLHLATQIRRPEILQFALPPPATKLDSFDFIKLLLARGADPKAQMTKGFIGLRTPLDMPLEGATPFFLAARVVDVPVMRLLLEKGADPLVTTKERATPLMTAAGVGYRQGESPGTEAEALAAVKLCVELGGNVNAANAIGFTALHGAAIRGANTIIQFLADNGARLEAKDRRGRTAFNLADEGAGDSNQRRQLQTAAFLRELMTRQGK